MFELTHRHKARLGEALLHADDDAFPDAIVPPDITPDIAAFAAELSPLPPQHIPRIEDDNATYGWPADNVRARIERDGGDLRLGWRLRECPGVLLMATCHAVWSDPQGALLDITTDVTEGDTSLFLPMPPDAPAAEPAQTPTPRYYITHRRPDTSADIAARIARMTPGQRAYEEKRASKAGKTLEQSLDDKHHPDKLQNLIAPFIKACQTFDQNLSTVPDLVAAEIARMEQPRATPAIEQEAADIGAGTVPPAGITGDDADGNNPDSKPDSAYDQVWVATDKIRQWSKPRRFFRNAIALAQQR